ncbi:hypothetical protein [Couchioplanes azureus]|uniref:hypothetical protein n=1 Tax=Couchioplanes caeruleus TaxID=56438 RepID=UPI00198AE9E0|nr:hypothetical protein [Couchioplanes caeruleus]GGQ38041.1 hypothetical protein GCM10010166_00510 [Couchioplanes caeruleus subsp. azureus]
MNRRTTRDDPEAAAGSALPSRDPARPRGLVSRSLIAAAVFVAAVLPGWALGDAAERWTGWGLLDWLVTCALSGVAVFLLAPYGSYRRRDAVLGLVPFYGWYLTSVLCWRIALLPLRDWEPREDELWRARWLTGDLIGFWRADPLPPPLPRRPSGGSRLRTGSAPRAGRPTR